ncbi:ABC transporter substrate-binding protein [Piscinibacter koreensis]|uniref:ABC transporter substrate-binding protein n=1 Tax=Piscinibacter koreensis TaxID=2742824 RepID=A0A7Y6NMH8_9BURK|nr:ABC transporter substrate-binding protein [Schlegelella koreensis]NUZ05926.1 ABC transporter substrate-binding protein [Schlegelella koreensis]
MKRLVVAAVIGTLGSTVVHAQTLRWASQGDPQTMDPHSQNESLTNQMNGQVYERLTSLDRQLNIVPGLASEWQQVSPLVWRFKLRPNVKFHDGSPFTADDVVYSIQRAQQKTSQVNNYAVAVGTPRKVDDLTVEFQLAAPNPIFLQHLNGLWMMSRSWSEKNKVTRPLDFAAKEESFASLHANGTGPYMLASRAPGIRTTYRRNPAYWGRIEGNVQEIVFTPIANDATRLAALVSGEVDFVLDPSPRDVPRLKNTPGVKVIEGPENRIVFIGMDQGRDELLYSNVKGKNPFKDVRVRRALYQAIDIETIRSRLMNGQSFPTGGMTPSPKGAYNDPELERRLPYDLAEARKLMQEAGYPDGFEVQLDCPNNRYINDDAICVALASMWAQLKVKVKVLAQPRVTYFPKMQKYDLSMYMLGWGGDVTDAETTLTPVMRNPGENGIGSWNWGRSRNDKFDALAAQSSVEADPKKRELLVKSALREWKEQVHTIPLHRQVIPWAARSNVNVVHRADNWLEVQWVTVGK